MFSNKSRGFTLIELLVVIAVIGVLSAVLVGVLNPVSFFEQGRDGRRVSDLSSIKAAVEAYYAQNSSYPTDVPAGGTPWSSGGVTYLKSVPKDPDGSTDYKYCPDSASSPANYQVCAQMEDSANLPDDCVSGSYTLNDNCTVDVNCCLTNPF